MDAQAHPHGLLEAVEEGQHPIQDAAAMRHREGEGVDVRQHAQGILAHAVSPVMTTAVKTEQLARKGYLFFSTQYEKVHVC